MSRTTSFAAHAFVAEESEIAPIFFLSLRIHDWLRLLCVFADGTRRRRRPAGSETWICAASRCCCPAVYPCSPASSSYAARNTWKVRNVRTLCYHNSFHKYPHSPARRSENREPREFGGGFASRLLLRIRNTTRIINACLGRAFRAKTHVRPRACFIAECFAASVSHVMTSFLRARTWRFRECSAGSGVFSARSIYRKVESTCDGSRAEF